MKRALILLVFVSGCAKPLSELLPFACADDGTCPSGLACVPGVGCTAARIDSPCREGFTDCSAADPDAVCSMGVCALGCADGTGCPPGRTCSIGSGSGGSCIVDCTHGESCPAGLMCKDLWYTGTRGCVSDMITPAACRNVEVTGQCTFCGDTNTLPVVECPGFTCPAHGTCGDNVCNCEPGFKATACDGRECSQAVPCPAPNWWCKPNEELSASCSDTPLRVSGVCHCADGSKIEMACGNTLSCEERCASGCDTVRQDCPSPLASKCSVTLVEHVWSAICTEEYGGLPEGATCAYGEGGLGHDDCAAGLFCVVYGVDSTTQVCRRFCRLDADCDPTESCYAVDPLIPGDGACVPRCSILADDCPSGLSCQPFLNRDDTTYFPFCRSIGNSGPNGPCESPLDCAVDTACHPFASGAEGRTCKRICDDLHPCPMVACTPLPGLPNGGGLCL